MINRISILIGRELIYKPEIRVESLFSPRLSKKKELIMDSIRYSGNYFEIQAADKKRLPCFTRCLIEVLADNTRCWLMETTKKVTGRNPEWIDCFGVPHRVTVLTRELYKDMLSNAQREERVLLIEGTSTADLEDPRSIGRVNRDVNDESSKNDRKQRLMNCMERVANSNNMIKTKFELLLEDPDVIHKWSSIKEGATLIRLMNQRDSFKSWTETQKLRPWQSQLMREIDQLVDDDRVVLWVMDAKGGSGKTWFTKFLYRQDPDGTAWLQNGKTSDLIKIISEQVFGLHRVLIDLCRSNEERINWDAIERIKNGMIMSTKYEVEATIIDSPTVICFANFEPDLKKLSLDRWKVYEIVNGVLGARAVAMAGTEPYLEPPIPCADDVTERKTDIPQRVENTLEKTESGNYSIMF